MAKKPPSGREGRGGHPTSPNKPPPEKEVAAKRHEIARHYDALDAKAREARPKKNVPQYRVSEIGRLIVDRYGTKGLPDDRAGREILAFALESFAHVNQDYSDPARKFAENYAPWLPAEEFNSLWERVFPLRPFADSDEAGLRVDLMFDERDRLRIGTMFCVDKTKEEVREILRNRKRARDRDRQRKKRQPMIQQNSESSARQALGYRELAILSQVGKKWTAAPALIKTLTSEPAFAELSANSMRTVFHRLVDRLQRCGKVETTMEDGEGRKRKKLVRAAKSS